MGSTNGSETPPGSRLADYRPETIEPPASDRVKRVSSPSSAESLRAEKLKNAVLFLVPVLIWGSTWLVIRFQLGVVEPLVSVSYRFILAGLLLVVGCLLQRRRMRFGLGDHLFMILQGICLFGINYWLVYEAESNLTSGLVALVFSLIILFNVFNGAVLLKAPVRPLVVAGGLIGIAGLALVFFEELAAFSLSDQNAVALLLTVTSTFLASLGNIIAARNQKAGLPVVPVNAYSMLYGGLVMALVAWSLDLPFRFDASVAYVTSLGVLAIAGSIVAFGFYLTLLGRIGADKAAYVALVMPLIAILLSTIFEGYRWTSLAIAGVVLVSAGNLLALRSRS